jgi:C4-dicarboxylate-specific signal transduction histidine kinase
LVCNLAPAPARGDASLVDRVITNLLTNAIHYNKTNGEVRISTPLENRTAVLTVADTGQGIAPEDLPHIFERFYRADKSRARANGLRLWARTAAASESQASPATGPCSPSAFPRRGGWTNARANPDLSYGT